MNEFTQANQLQAAEIRREDLFNHQTPAHKQMLLLLKGNNIKDFEQFGILWTEKGNYLISSFLFKDRHLAIQVSDTINKKDMVSIIMGSQSDMPVMEKAKAYLEENNIAYEVNVMSAHRNPEAVAEYAKTAKERGVKVIIAGAGMAAALPGVIAAYTTLPVIGVPIKSGALQGIDALLAIVQMPPGVPVATMAIDGAKNAAVFAHKILQLCEEKQ